MRRTRSGPSIREFLQYYLLVLLSEKAQTKQELVREIKERSADNRLYRPSGVLWVASTEMDNVLSNLQQTGLIELDSANSKWAITWHGRRMRRRIERESQSESDGKERAAEKLIELLEAAPSGSYVLDVGTGGGFLALKLAERGFRVLGIDSGSFDYSKDSIQEAQQQVASQGGNVEFRQADIRKLAEPDNSFDYVVSSQAIHCMEAPRECLQAIHRLLKPGGRFLCTDFLVGLRGFLAHGFHCFLAISCEEWVELLVDVGFGNIRMYEMDDYLLIESQKT
ncbi:MAG: class I SAM-dependent methyltransferase [Armatimonadetes bacterium]|nr:class I SAM-dependent methyltransferase [Armatimonadota bacterium]